MISFTKTSIILSLLISLPVISQVPYMVKDLNPGSGDINGFGLYPINNGVLFINNDLTNGHELWYSDGTSNGTYLVKDINPGSQSSIPSNFISFNNKYLFWANDGVSGNELWETNGTSNGTKLLKDLIPGGIGGIPSYTYTTGSKIYFTMNYPGLGGELYVSDGTSAGTFFLKDINPGISNSYADNFISDTTGNVFFSADNGITGSELWFSDGTAIGTVLLKDINPGITSSYIKMFKTNGNLLYFTARDPINGFELWRSDGTTIGTFLLKDVTTGTNSTTFVAYETCKNKFFFYYGSSFGETDGTVVGTKTLFHSPSQGSFWSNLYNFNNKIYYFRKKFPSSSNHDSLHLYCLNDSINNYSLISRSNYPRSQNGQRLIIEQTNGNKFLFHEFQPPPTSMWLSYGPKITGIIGIADGTPSGTSVSHLKSVHFFKEEQKLLPFLNNQWITLMSLSGTFSDFEFHSIDYNSGLASLVKDINPSGNSAYFPKDSCYDYGWCYNRVVEGNKLYFIANDGMSGYELFETDGTTSGTKLLLDIYPGQVSGLNAGYGDCASEIVSSGGRLFFYANNSINGTELWSMGVNIGIKENNFVDDLTVYPNPANSILNIKSENSLGKSTISVTDILGKTIIETKNSDLYQTSINIEQLSSGVYLLNIRSEKGLIVKKFVKE